VVVNLQNYKLAKEFIKDSKMVLRALELSIRALTPFNKYKPISQVLGEMRAQKAIMEAHLRTAHKIIAKAGETNDQST
jgi:hypothetical protein